VKIIGITGGVGTGKSKVLAYLETKQGATVRQLDQVAKGLQEAGAPCYDEIIEVFGSGILLPNKELNRPELARVIFKDKEKRQLMNQIIHPQVKEWIRSDIKEEQLKGTSLYVIEAALLVEDNYKDICDELWFIYSEKSVRIERLGKSRGYSRDKVEEIMAVQLTDEEFCKNTNLTIDNSGDFEDTINQVEESIFKI
jgi:dephospho-CoA kinase